MRPVYADFIQRLERQAAQGYGLTNRCREAVEFMQESFPELRAECGRVTLENGERYCHWWAVSPEDDIVDPTAIQFESPPARYVRIQDEDPVPTGQCLECMDYRYGRGGYCSPRCYRKNYRRRKAIPDGDLMEVLAVMARMDSPAMLAALKADLGMRR